MVKGFDIPYCKGIKAGGGASLLYFFLGEGEATGVAGEGLCPGGGAYGSQSGGRSVASSSLLYPVIWERGEAEAAT